MRKLLVRFVLIIFTTLVTFSSSQAEYIIFTPEEEAKRDAECAKDLDCVLAWAEVKQRVADGNAELDEECNAHPANCEKATLVLAADNLRRLVECDGDPTTCRDSFNETAEEVELKLINSSWCGYYPRPCELVKRNREERRVAAKVAEKNKTLTNKMWCDSYPGICDQAISYRSQRLLEEAKRARQADEKSQLRRVANIRERLLAQIAKHEAMLTTCDTLKTCDSEINIRIGLAATQREAQWCKDQVEACDLVKDLREGRKLAGKTWCQVNPDLCRAAREKFQDENKKNSM